NSEMKRTKVPPPTSRSTCPIDARSNLICGLVEPVEKVGGDGGGVGGGGVDAVCVTPERGFPQLGQLAVPSAATVWQLGHAIEAMSTPRSVRRGSATGG